MKIACLIALLTGLQLASAADAPKPITDQVNAHLDTIASGIESLRAENELLKAKLAQAGLESQYQMMVCQSPDVMTARLATFQSQQKADAAKSKPDEAKKNEAKKDK